MRFENIVGKGENAASLLFLLFPLYFVRFSKQILIFQSRVFCRRQTLLIKKSLKFFHLVKSSYVACKYFQSGLDELFGKDLHNIVTCIPSFIDWLLIWNVYLLKYFHKLINIWLATKQRPVKYNLHLTYWLSNNSIYPWALRKNCCGWLSSLHHMPYSGSCDSAANKDMMLKIWTNRDTIIWSCRKHCGKGRNCSSRAISSFPTMFSKAVCCGCIKMSISGVKG